MDPREVVDWYSTSMVASLVSRRLGLGLICSVMLLTHHCLLVSRSRFQGRMRFTLCCVDWGPVAARDDENNCVLR